MASVLVTGGAGFIGSGFVRLLAGLGHKVTVLDLFTYAGHRANLAELEGKVEIVTGDIADEGLVTELLQKQGFDGIINFAAESHVDRSISGPGTFIHTNILGVFNLLKCSLAYYSKLDAARKSKFRYVQVSTDEVYGELGETGKFTEESPYKPNSPYSASKASGDMLARAWHHTYGLPTVTTNCSNNYGPRQFPEKLIPFMIKCALSDRPLGIYGNGKNVRDWIHVEDHCQGVMLAFEQGKPGETYCFGGNAERNNVEVVNKICEYLDELNPRADGASYKKQITYVADRPGHDHRYAIDDSYATEKLGFKRRYDFDSGLRATVAWYLENQAWVKEVTGGKG